MPTTHPFVNPKADGGDATITRPSDWNASHTGGPDLPTTLYDPGIDETLIAGATAQFDTDPLIIDSGRLITIPSTSLLWLDAPRRVGTPDGSLNVKDFGAKGDGVTDDTTALQAARDALAAVAGPGTLVFPAGIYRYSVSPNWAIYDVQIVAQGEVRLRYFGVGNAVILDGGATGPGVYNTRMGRFIVEGSGLGLNGVYCRAMHLGQFQFKIIGAGHTASAGLRTEWCVLSEFWISVSVNNEGWYSTPGTADNQPFDGIFIGSRTAPEPTSYCNFYNTDIAGIADIGIYLSNTLANNFYGGASEGCALYGAFAGANAVGDKFWGVDFEANTAVDFYMTAAADLALIECDSQTLTYISTGCLRANIIGGRYKTLTIDSTANSTVVNGAKVNRFNNGALFTDTGVNTRIISVLNVGTGLFYDTSGTNARVATFTNETIPSNYSTVTSRSRLIASGQKLSVLSGGAYRLL